MSNKLVKNQNSAIHGSASIQKALKILNIIGNSNQSYGLSELAKLGGIPKPSMHRILSTLTEEAFLRFNEINKTYHLGVRIFELAHKVWNEFDIRHIAQGELERMNLISDETTWLAGLIGNEIICIEVLPCRHPVSVNIELGKQSPFYCAAAGKAISAYMSEEEQDRLLNQAQFERKTEKTITNPLALKQALKQVKAFEYAIDDEEYMPEVCSISAPIFGPDSKPIGAIVVTGPKYRLDHERLHVLGRELIESSRRASGNIGVLPALPE